MIRQIIAYIAVFLLTLYCFFLYDHEIVAVMLVVEAGYFLISLLSVKFIKRKITITIEPVMPLAEKNSEIPVSILIRNCSKLLSAHVKMQIQMENVSTGEKIHYWVSAGSKMVERISVVFKAEHCGTIQISIRKCWIYDVLFILKDKKKVNETQTIAILPECHLLPVEVTRKTRKFIADAEEYSDRESGDDPSELYQLREYRDGDSIRDIYWKLSVKADEMLVKEHGRPMGCVVLIWLNLQIPEKRRKQVSSVILEAVSSLSLSLLEEKCVHMVAWYEPENQRIQKKRISKEAHIYELLHRLLYAVPYQESVKTQYEDAFRGHAFSTVVEFRADGTIFVDEEEKMRLSLQEGTQNWDELYFVV